MPQLTVAITDEVIAACRESADAVAAALTRAFGGEFFCSIGQTGQLDAAALPDGLDDGPGLAIVWTLGEAGAIALLPEATGFLPDWYAARFKRTPRWLQITFWCGFRNSFTGNPLHVRGGRPATGLGTRAPTHRVALATGRRAYSICILGWRAGLWIAWPMSDRAKAVFRKLGREVVSWAHWEIRFGWKGLPGSRGASYTPWDCGPRLT